MRHHAEIRTQNFAALFTALFATRNFTSWMVTISCVWCLSLGLSLLFSPTVDAAGLGRLKVESMLGQPFAAVIDITALQTEEFSQIEARIASAESYETAQLTYPSIVRQIRISTARQSDGKSILKLTSIVPINEPSLDLLVEFSWGNGRVTQKYSVLLDLPKADR